MTKNAATTSPARLGGFGLGVFAVVSVEDSAAAGFVGARALSAGPCAAMVSSFRTAALGPVVSWVVAFRMVGNRSSEWRFARMLLSRNAKVNRKAFCTSACWGDRGQP